MNNAELIKVLRWCGDENNEWCVLEEYKCPLWNEDRMIDECKEELMRAAADAYEAAEKRIAELEAQMLKIKSRIYDLESMAKREYDDDHDNEYLEGYFDGLHQAAKLISTTLSTEKR